MLLAVDYCQVSSIRAIIDMTSLAAAFLKWPEFVSKNVTPAHAAGLVRLLHMQQTW